MAIGKKIETDIIVAMKAKDEHKLTTLRMVKSALKNKEIDKREELTDAEESQILTTLIKQRKESVETFTKGEPAGAGGRRSGGDRDDRGVLPQAAGEERFARWCSGRSNSLTKDAAAAKPGPKDMGAAMKVAQQRILADGLRADGKTGERDGEGGAGEAVELQWAMRLNLV